MPSTRPYSFVKAIEFTLPWETGKERDGSLRKDGGLIEDTGGVTKYGISDRGDGIVDGKYDGKLIRDLTVEDAIEIYKKKYWDIYTGLKPVNANLDNLPAALAVAVFDAGVNLGVGRAIQWLGKALENKNPVKVVNDLRGARYFDLVSQDRAKYGPSIKGWTNRLNDLRKYCEILEAEAQANAQMIAKVKTSSVEGSASETLKKVGWNQLS